MDTKNFDAAWNFFIYKGDVNSIKSIIKDAI